MNTGAVPYLPRGVRLHFDKVRKTNVLLGPERALMLDDISHIILQQLDDTRTINEICAYLAEEFTAPLELITDDTLALLTDLANRRLLESRNV